MIAALSRWWFAPAPSERLAALRVLIGLFAVSYLVGRLPHFLGVSALPASSWRPIGVVSLALDSPLAPGWWWLCVGATVGLGVLFTLGVAYRWSAPLFAAGLLLVMTYRSSWGMVFHTENLLVLHTAALAFSPAADAWSVDARREALRATAAGRPPWQYGWALRTAAVLTVVTYVLAGLAKVRLGGYAWLGGEQLRNQIAVDNARKLLLGDSAAPLATLLFDHPRLCATFAIATMAVELGAPLALLGGAFARAWSVAAWSFHLGVVLFMAIVFPYPLAGVAFAPFLALEKPGARLLAWTKSIRATRPSPANT